jgi:hypothetical protein
MSLNDIIKGIYFEMKPSYYDVEIVKITKKRLKIALKKILNQSFSLLYYGSTVNGTFTHN